MKGLLKKGLLVICTALLILPLLSSPVGANWVMFRGDLKRAQFTIIKAAVSLALLALTIYSGLTWRTKKAKPTEKTSQNIYTQTAK